MTYHRHMANPTNTPMGHGDIPRFSLGDRLRKAREYSGMEMRDLAAAIDIHRQSVARYENGTAVPKRHVMLSWSMVTGVDLSWIVTGDADSTHDDRSAPTTDLADFVVKPDFNRGIPRFANVIKPIFD